MALPVAHGWIVFHPSGAYVTFTQAGVVRYAADHFFKCEACGGFFDMRDLAQVLDREAPLSHPVEDQAQ